MSNNKYLQTKIFEEILPKNNSILSKFIEICGDKLYEEFILKSAKGGLWAKQAEIDNKDISNCRHDQNMYSHVMNGILAVIELVNYLKEKEIKEYSELEIMLYLVSFSLHDIDKIKGYEYKGKNLLSKTKELLEYCKELNFDLFFSDTKYGYNIEDYISEITYLIINTELSNPLAVKGSKMKEIHNIRHLCTLSDKMTYFIKKPSDINNRIFITENEGDKLKKTTSIQELIAYIVGDGSKINLCYHKIPESKGILGNIINNCIIDIYRELGFTPYLIFTEGVIYIGNLDKEPNINSDDFINEISNKVWDNVKYIITETILYSTNNKFKGIEFNNKYKKIEQPKYYLNFLDEKQYFDRSLEVILNLNLSKKDTEDKKPYDEEIGILNKISNKYNYKENDIISKIAYYVSFLDSSISKKDIFTQLILEYFNFTQEEIQYASFIINDKEHDKKLKLTSEKLYKAKLYWLAHVIYEKNSHLDLYDEDKSIETKIKNLNDLIISKSKENENFFILDKFENFEDNVKNYIKNIFNLNTTSHIKEYSDNQACTICNSFYDNLIQDNFVPFQKTTYKSKLPLNLKLEVEGGKLGYICQICYLEFALRQMKIKNYSSGKDFESKNTKYIHFYPSYFFTFESSKLIRSLVDDIFNTDIEGIMKIFISISSEREFLLSDIEKFYKFIFTQIPEVTYNFSDKAFKEFKNENLDNEIIKSLEKFLGKNKKEKTFNKEIEELNLTSEQKAIVIKHTSELADNSSEIVKPDFKSFSDDFIFTNINIGHSNPKKTETEASIVPSFLNLFLSLALNCKTVLTEGLTNIYSSQEEIKETVVFSDMNQSIKILLSQNKFLLDEIFDNLKKLLSLYSICYESFGASKFNPIAKISRDISSDKLSIFTYFGRIKSEKKGIDKSKLSQCFINYLYYLGGEKEMDLIKEITTSFYGFHRVSRFGSSYSITKPVRIIFETLLSIIDLNRLSDESIIMILYDRLRKFRDSSKSYSEVWGDEKETKLQEFATIMFEKVFVDYCKRNLSNLIKAQNYLAGAVEAQYYVMDKNNKDEKILEKTQSKTENINQQLNLLEGE